jgi:hypothetical protein
MAAPWLAGASKQLNQHEQYAPAARNALVHLIATMLSAHTPLAEVFAIVREHVVAIFS